uniref:Chondroitin proteoglycan 4 domain-containing protein n=2 Tax=Strongyloides stercoralis TaxID=6248 RepID=A0AAF5I3K2_STRER
KKYYTYYKNKHNSRSLIKLICASGVLTILIFSISFYFYFTKYLSVNTYEPKISQNIINKRFKRDFMFVSNKNISDPGCFKSCNDEWIKDFEKSFGMNHTEFYDFPFHPTLLEYTNFLKYCELADKQTNCFINRCDDQSADKVFSPSNYICQFKRTQFVQARPCLEETEPLTFLKCDQECHKKALNGLQLSDRDTIDTIYSNNNLDMYEKELNFLCGFQECYKNCHKDIVKEFCSPSLSNTVYTLIDQYIKWHATDIYDWHILTNNLEKLPYTCLRLTGYTSENDKVAKLIAIS